MSSGDHGREKILRTACAKEIAIKKMKPKRARLRFTKKKRKGLSREGAKEQDRERELALPGKAENSCGKAGEGIKKAEFRT